MVRAWPRASVPSIQCRLCAESTGMLSYGHFVQFLRGENVQNLFYVFRHQRQMPLARVIVSVAVWNGRGHVVPHRGRGIGVRLAMPKLDCHSDVLGAEIPTMRAVSNWAPRGPARSPSCINAMNARWKSGRVNTV